MYYIQGKGYFEESGKPVGSKRKIDLELAKVYGYHNNLSDFTMLQCESRVRRELLIEQWHLGQSIKSKEQNQGAATGFWVRPMTKMEGV